MSEKIKREGTFMAYPVSSGVDVTKANGYPQFVAQFACVQEYDFEDGNWVDISGNDEEIRGFFVLAGKDQKPTLNAKQISLAVDWKSGDLAELNGGDYSEVPVQIRVEKSDNEKYPYGVNWIDHKDADPTQVGTVKKLDESDIAKLSAIYGANLKLEIGGGEKPKTVKGGTTAKKSPPKTPAKKDKDTKDQEGGTVDKEAAKVAAKAAIAEKKKRAAAAEAKAVPPKPPKRTKPPKAPAPTVVPETTSTEPQDGAEVSPIPANLTQDAAWELCESKFVTDGDSVNALTTAWTATVEDLGGDETVAEEPDGWTTVASIVFEKLSDVVESGQVCVD